ncbi:AAA family ATPase [Acetivibrio straminisolvens]|jgi:cellulose biosynthesis protein BcsQ|uniref:AAA domain-containing protein n=1 Tax=Acetivibrio straminisolvens JCM 21531 TaxID=1294263 RepID=W4VA38_9FIRM|nr:AAA family ATPase [Acetivibrio straminisolvens]GAE90036.1 hypothetical protein JCM21531_3617 [Acetivibrio straminisolvens JCM 21531]
MRRLNLVIADTDEVYVRNMVDYLMTNYLQRLRVSSFTRQELLYDFLSGLNKIDVLLISPDMYSEAMPKESYEKVFLLTQGEPSVRGDIDCVNKHQVGEEFINKIIDMFSDGENEEEKKEDAVILEEPSRNVETKVIAIYSPIGGAGKTTIAVNSAVYCAKKGLKVFYLNLETFQSTPLYFNCKSEKNLSELLRCLKQGENIGMKIREIRQIDPDYDVHYFVPPENIIDLKDTGSGEIKALIDAFRAMRYYDIVILDMSSELNDRNIALLDSSDEVVMVLAQDAISNVKAEFTSEQLEKYLAQYGLNLSGKLIVALNKYNFHMALEVDTVCIDGEAVSVYLSFVPGMTAVKGIAQMADIQGDFGAGIEELMDKYIKL